MADEIRFATELSVTNGGNTAAQSVSDNADQTTPGVLQKRQTIPTTAGGTVVALTGLTAARWLQIKNVDATNYVEVGPESGGTIIGFSRLKAGESMQLPLKPAVVTRALANTASVIIELTALET